MKIKSLYISAFGGIKDMTLDFSDGFNVVYGNNENGKSTVMAFIKMMFYGSDRASALISKNMRKKYTPWDSSAMGGSITFEHGGRNYRLEKEFHSSNSTDKATLCDLDFGTRQAVGSDIGARFFGLSAAAFERSVFISRFGYPENDTAAEGEINSKLSNIVLSGDESVSFEKVNGRLEKARLELMSKSGRAGEYDKNLKRCGELQEEISTAEGQKADYERRIKEIALAQENLDVMRQKAEILKKQLSAEQDARNAEKLKDYLRLKEKLDAVNGELRLSDGTLADEVYLGKLRFGISKAQSAINKADAKRQEISALKQSLEIGLNPPKNATKENAECLAEEIAGLENKKSQYENRLAELEAEAEDFPKNSKTAGLLPIFTVLAVIFALLTVAAVIYAASFAIPAVTALFSAAFICLAFVSLRSKRKSAKAFAEKTEAAKAEREKITACISETEQTVFEKRVSLEAVNTALNSNAAVLENQRKMLDDARLQSEVLEQEESAQLQSLLKLFSVYRTAESLDDVISSVDVISEKAATQKEIKNQLNFIIKDIGNISYEAAQSKLAEIGKSAVNTSADFEALKREYSELTEKITGGISAIAAAQAYSKTAVSHFEKLPALKNELKELSQKTARQKYFCDSADIAMAVLRESFAQVRQGYGSVLEKKAGEIFSHITDNRYGSMDISKSFDINVSESERFGGRDIGYLSSGTADQAYLSLRLALSELICDGKEALPLLLDDSLAQYDDGRAETALKYLKKHSENSQTVMFTCHKSLSDAAHKNGAVIISLSPLGGV